jgi:glycosyltransferase involved in cell wall biosynthesis
VRLLFLNANRSPAYGGIERWMIDAATGLRARGATSVMLGRPGAPWLRAAVRSGLRVREDIRGAWVQRAWRVGAAMRAERPDLVVAKGKKTARWATWGRAAAGGRVALIFGLTHELDPQRWVDRHTWRAVDGGIVLAHGAARWYAERGFGPPAKLHVLWKGVDLAAFDAARSQRDAVRATLGLAPDTLAVGAVGRLAWQKGFDQLLDAIRLVRPRLPRARFFVIGGGRDGAAIAQAAAAPELAGAVTLLGQRDDVPALLAAMDLVVQSSRQEVMAQTTLEAMAAGRAVVSTATMGADEAIEDGVSGLLVPVGDVAGLAEGIARLARDPAQRAALGSAARARTAEEFTAARMLDRAERIFTEIAGLERARLAG